RRRRGGVGPAPEASPAARPVRRAARAHRRSPGGLRLVSPAALSLPLCGGGALPRAAPRGGRPVDRLPVRGDRAPERAPVRASRGDGAVAPDRLAVRDGGGGPLPAAAPDRSSLGDPGGARRRGLPPGRVPRREPRGGRASPRDLRRDARSPVGTGGLARRARFSAPAT